MKKQTEYFKNESLRYVSSYLDSKPDFSFLEGEEIFKDFTPKNVLDVGCGNGNSIEIITNRFNCLGTGIEPSRDAIDLLKSKFLRNVNINFISSSAHSLPFPTDSFDLVWTWSVLHWIGRNEYLQALGELVRVSSKYLIIMDFVAAEDYRTVYHHNKDFFTYKMDFEPAILASGIMDKVYEKSWWTDPKTGESFTLQNKSSLKPFLKKSANYHSRKMVVFKKNYNRIQTLSSTDFL